MARLILMCKIVNTAGQHKLLPQSHKFVVVNVYLPIAARDCHIDVVLVDTAGRMQDNEPLMRSLAKVKTYCT